MVNPRQRRKARSSAHKTVKHSQHAKRNLKKMKPIRGPKALQDAWDNKKTLRQNYAAMGLVGSLRQADSGGSECPVSMIVTRSCGEAGPSTRSTASTFKDDAVPQKFGKILRDADGSVIGVEILGDNIEPDGEDTAIAEQDQEGDRQRTQVVDELERLAHSAKSVPRFSSGGEIAVLRKLVAKHGHDFEAMAKDRRLNTWQRTAGQLQRASKNTDLV